MKTVFVLFMMSLSVYAFQQPDSTSAVLPFPPSGIMNIRTSAERPAPFKINADSTSCYYIKMVEVVDKKEFITLFVRRGESILVDVPLGRFEIRYVTGEKWYGERELFGRDSQYFKLDACLEFAIEGERIRGHELTLYRVINGNISSKTISKSEF